MAHNSLHVLVWFSVACEDDITMACMITQVKGVMQQNIGAVMERGAVLNDLEGRAGEDHDIACVTKHA